MKGIMFNEHFGLESAVFSGRKTQTRRFDKKLRGLDDAVRCGHKYFRIRGKFLECHTQGDFKGTYICYRLPYQVGEVVAIKQSYSTILDNISKNESIEKANYFSKIVNSYDHKGDDFFVYSCEETIKGWRNKMFVKNDLMPHHIKITNIRVERLQDISIEGCIKEGVIRSRIGYYVEGIKCKDWSKEHHVDTDNGLTWKLFPTVHTAFAALIDKVNGKGTWKSNPYVWVYDFELLTNK